MAAKFQGSKSNEPIVLVVAPGDDADVFEAFLRSQGIRALTVPSGLHAQQILGNGRVAALFSDKELPGIDGFDLLVLVHDRWPRIRRVLMVSRPTGDLVMRARTRADARVLTKPVLPSVLLRVAHEELEAYAAETTRSG